MRDLALTYSFRTVSLTLVATCLGIASTTATVWAQSDRLTFVHNGEDRHYFITVPDLLVAPPEGVPLVLVLHGAGGNGPNVMAMTGFDEKAEEEGFIAVFPEGTPRDRVVGDTLLLTWNAGHCCGYSMRRGADDIGFISALIDELTSVYSIDPTKIYLAGMSNGGMMTHRLAIALSDRIAAIGTVVGAMFGDEAAPASPVPAIVFNAALDEMIPLEGGELGARLFQNAWDGTPLEPSVYQATFWAATNGCQTKPSYVERKPLYAMSVYECPEGLDVRYYVVEDNGHAWPGDTRITPLGRDATNDFSATDVIWDFFAQHQLVILPHEAKPAPAFE